MDNDPKWKIYERAVAWFTMENASINSSIIPNAFLVGSISGTKRQIDIVVQLDWQDRETTRRIIIDTKRRKRKLDIGDVEQFEGLMKDVEAHHGKLVCTNGWTAAAEERAGKKIDLEIISFEEVLSDPHSIILCPHCESRPHGGVVFFWGPPPFIFFGLEVATLVFLGKCDGCRRFAVSCCGCGEALIVDNSQEVTCGCGYIYYVDEEDYERVLCLKSPMGEIPIDGCPLT